jgi:diamine N-acetyltransferase
MSITPAAVERVTLRRVTAETVTDVCHLSETLSPAQREMVADNGQSIAEAHFSENAWFRAIYLGEEIVGFVMVHVGADWHDGISCPGAFLWRLMVAGGEQGKGIGAKALALVIADLRARGFKELFVSYGLGEASPEPFYRGLGFVPTGAMVGEEVEAKLVFAD